jgi:hypothetical protein
MTNINLKHRLVLSAFSSLTGIQGYWWYMFKFTSLTRGLRRITHEDDERLAGKA